MVSAAIITFLVIISVETLIGLLTNGFIVAVNCLDLVGGQSLNSCDLLLLAIGLCNIPLQCIQFVGSILIWKWIEIFFLNSVYLVLNFLFTGMVIFNFWLTALLCVFYCVRIVNINRRPFLWLKAHISKVISWLILGAVVRSLVLSIPVFWNVHLDLPQNATTNLTANSTVEGGRLRWTSSYALTSIVLGCSLPLLLVVVSIALILASLCEHTRRMKQNSPDFSKPNLQAHFMAIRTVVSIFFIYLSFYVAYTGYLILNMSTPSDGIYMCIVVLYAFSPAQSIVLILGNSKLKLISRRILHLAANGCKRHIFL